MAVRDEGSTLTPQGNPLLTYVRDNLGLLIPIIGAVIFALRCLVVSGGDPYVASILVAETSVGDAVRALLLTVVPVLLLLLSYVLAFGAMRRIVSGTWRDFTTPGMFLLSLVASLGVWFFIGIPQEFSWPDLLFVALGPFVIVLPVAWAFKTRDDLKRTQKRDRMASNRVLIAFYTVASVLVALLVIGLPLVERTFWLPRERLAFQNEAPFTGYVLKASEDHLTILNDRPRIIVERPKATLQDRDFCYPEDHKARSSKMVADSPVCP